MHMLFTEDEKQWIDTRKFGWPIKKGCPENVRKRILSKKKKMDNQNLGVLRR